MTGEENREGSSDTGKEIRGITEMQKRERATKPTIDREGKGREGWQMGEKYWLRLMDFKGQSSMLYNSAHNSCD